MVKTYKRVRHLDKWLAHFPGQGLMETEQAHMRDLLPNFIGNEAILIGTPLQLPLLKSSSIPGKSLLTPIVHTKSCLYTRYIESELSELPLASGSLDLVILPHILELVDNPQQLLAESCRVLKPQGHIMIYGFNPLSLWGLSRLLFKRERQLQINYLKPYKIKAWLKLADFELKTHDMIQFRPPLHAEKLYHRLRWMEWISQKCLAPFGGVYVLLAQAKVTPLTPIKMKWKQPLAGFSLPAFGGLKPSTRNRAK